jgi:class 3 adenylate cyclase
MLDEPGKVLGGVLSDAGVKPADLRMRLLPSEFVPSGLPGFAWASDKELSSIQQFTSKNRLQTLTIMFDDIVGSTVLGSRLGATEFHRVCKRHDETVAKIVMRERVGKVIKSTGDGLLMVFCGPSAAVERALEIQAAFHKDAHLKLRIGIDMGQIMQTADGPLRDIFGPRVATARRITDVAKEGGHVLTSKAVYDDASQWLPKEKVLWQGLGSVSCKPGEPPLDIYEAYNPAITKPMASLEGR